MLALHKIVIFGQRLMVVLLHYYQGYGISDIAQMLDIAEGTVSSRLSRARSKLRISIDGEAES